MPESTDPYNPSFGTRTADMAPDCAIAAASKRIRRFGQAIEQGHSLGISPGPYDEPWKPSFHRTAVHIYALTLPWDYLQEMAFSFRRCVDFMERTRLRCTDACDDWRIVKEYLCSAADAVKEACPVENGLVQREPRTVLVEPFTPPIVPFDRLAGLVSTNGAQRLTAAGRAIEVAAAGWACPLDEAEQDWLRRMRRGDRTIDIATDHGYSERGMYRALSALYTRIGVTTRAEAISTAAAKAWI